MFTTNPREKARTRRSWTYRFARLAQRRRRLDAFAFFRAGSRFDFLVRIGSLSV